MNHNIDSFSRNGREASDLVHVYCDLISLELKLKKIIVSNEWSPPDNLSHDLPSMLDIVAEKQDSQAHTIIRLQQDFIATISKIKCIKRNGNIGTVRKVSYPDIRYAALKDDYNNQGCDLSCLTDLSVVTLRIDEVIRGI